jgi:hypothetical protein
MTARVGGRTRTAIIACSPRPSEGRSTSAKNPSSTPRSRRERTRSRQVEGAGHGAHAPQPGRPAGCPPAADDLPERPARHHGVLRAGEHRRRAVDRLRRLPDRGLLSADDHASGAGALPDQDAAAPGRRCAARHGGSLPGRTQRGRSRWRRTLLRRCPAAVRRGWCGPGTTCWASTRAAVRTR